MRGRIKRILQSRHTISPEDDEAVPYWDISENFEQVDGLFSGIDLLAIFVGFGSLLAGIIGVGNIMWIIVKERTQEIGIRRAIGARPRDIIAQILSEAVVLTTVAGVGEYALRYSYSQSPVGLLPVPMARRSVFNWRFPPRSPYLAYFCAWHGGPVLSRL